MELVFVLLAVILLVILPVAFLVFAIGGLFYAIRRAFGRGDRENTLGLSTSTPGHRTGAAKPMVARIPPSGGRRGA